MKKALLIVGILLLGGCNATTGSLPALQGQGKNIGAAIGAVGGGLIATAACQDYICQGLGIAVGMAGGYLAGDMVDKVYDMHSQMAKLQAVSTMQPVAWNAPGTPHSGVINPLAKSGNCVIFEDSENYKNKFAASKHGRACQHPDGSWEIQ
jgi:hypothetical protein